MFSTSFCLPTVRNRYVDVLRTWDGPDTEFLISYELDNPELYRLTDQNKESFQATIREFEHSCSKLGGNVSVWNALAKTSTSDAIMLLGDDLYNKTGNWKEIVEKNIPNFINEAWAVVGDDSLRLFGDKTTWDRKLAGHPLFTHKYFDLFGYGWNPLYLSQWCDAEFFEVGIGIERLIYLPEWVYDNQHPVSGKTKKDKWWDVSRNTYQSGKVIFDQKERINKIIEETKTKLRP